jgi:hypothetical protein
MSVSYGGDSITFGDGSIVASGSQGFKNKIINGAMMIDQRNAGATVTPLNGSYTLDRWKCSFSAASKFTVGQSSTAPVGFTNSFLATVSNAYTITSGDYFVPSQKIEGYNIADLGWGTANAKTVTLSFWVRSSVTGTFAVTILNSANDRSYPATYTINSANTFEYKTITIAGDTSGTWLTTNGIGLDIYWNLGMGSTYSGTANAWQAGTYYSATGATSIVGTAGATFYLTGVQLEKGTTASSFEYRSYGAELALCQRYYAKLGGTTSGEALAVGMVNDAPTAAWFTVKYPTTMRAAPTLAYSSIYVTNQATYNYAPTSIRGQTAGLDSASFGINFATGGTTFTPVTIITSATAGYISMSAEL